MDSGLTLLVEIAGCNTTRWQAAGTSGPGEVVTLSDLRGGGRSAALGGTKKGITVSPVADETMTSRTKILDLANGC